MKRVPVRRIAESMPRWLDRVVALVTLSLVLTPDIVSAQILRGRVLEVVTGRPVVLARVMLLDTAFAQVAATVTDEEGRYSIDAPFPGDFFVAVDRIGYEPMLDGIITLGRGGMMPADIHVRPRPLQLEGLSAEAERRRTERVLTDAGFYERRDIGLGDFISPEEIERRKPVRMADVFRNVLSIQVRESVAGEQFLCNGSEPRVIVNGVYVTFPKLFGANIVSNVIIDQVVGVGDVAGIEVYKRPSELPLQWSGTGLDRRRGLAGRPRCTIVIWTKG